MSTRERFVVVCGLPGAGKTTVAEEIADRTDAELLRTDVVRKEMVPDPAYTPEETRRAYDELFERAAAVVEAGGAVVLDGTFRQERFRAEARTVAADVDATFDLVKVECSEEVVRERIAEREGDESDADFDVHELLREEFETVDAPDLTVDNSGALPDTRQQVAAKY